MSIISDKNNDLNPKSSSEGKITGVVPFGKMEPTNRNKNKMSQSSFLEKKVAKLNPSLTEKNKRIFYAHFFHLEHATRYIEEEMKKSGPIKYSNSMSSEKNTHIWKFTDGGDISPDKSYQFPPLSWKSFNDFILSSLGVNKFSQDILPYTTMGMQNFGENNYLARPINGKNFTFSMPTALLGYGVKSNSSNKSHKKGHNNKIRRNTLPFQCGLISYYNALKEVQESWARDSISKIDMFYNKEGATPIWCKFEWALKNYFKNITLNGEKWNANFKWNYDEDQKFQIQITLYSMSKPKFVSQAKVMTNPPVSKKNLKVEESKQNSAAAKDTYASKLKKSAKKESTKKKVEESEEKITEETIVSALQTLMVPAPQTLMVPALQTPMVSVPVAKGAPKKKKAASNNQEQLKDVKVNLLKSLVNL